MAKTASAAVFGGRVVRFIESRATLTAMSIPPHELRRLRSVAAEGADLDRLVARRLSGEPLGYIEGTAAFGALELTVDPRVLIPRPETEQLWELARELISSPRIIVDLCTGSGALALALGLDCPAARVFATEISSEAAEVARLNAKRLGIEIEILEGDLFCPLPAELQGSVDLVVSNPPYVAETEWPELPDDVRREPRLALVAGPTGTEVIDAIAGEVGRWLRSGGWVAVEIGETQGEHCRGVFADSLEDVQVRRDLAGRDRFLIGKRP